VVLLLIPFRRFRAAFAGQVGAGDFRYGESARVPGEVSIPNRNYMNLLELPVLFYIVCVLDYVTGPTVSVCAYSIAPCILRTTTSCTGWLYLRQAISCWPPCGFCFSPILNGHVISRRTGSKTRRQSIRLTTAD